MSISNRFCVKNPDLLEIEEFLEKHVNNYNKKVSIVQEYMRVEITFY